MNIPSKNKTIVAMLKQLAGDHVRGITFIESSDKQRFVSYAEFIDNIQFCRYNMHASGISAGDELVIQTEDCYSFLVIFWAAVMDRIVPVPLAVGKQAGQKKKVHQVWQQLSRPWVAVDGESGRQLEQSGVDDDPVIKQIRERAVSIGYLTTPRQRQEDDPVIEPGDMAYIQYSSGSTGLPKGVVLTHANLFANASAIVTRSRTTYNDRMLSWMPLTHDMGMICFHLSGIFAGIDQCIMPTGLFIRRPLLWMKVASDKGATLLYSPNFGLQFFLTALKKSGDIQWDLSAVRLLFNGAEQISPRLCQEFVQTLSPFGLKERVMYPGYGLAEASVAVSLPDPMDDLRTHAIERATLKPGFPVLFSENDNNATCYAEVGYPVPDCEVRIVHDGQVLPEAWLGSIEIRGENVTKGYYRKMDGSTDLFAPDGWLRTGDQGFLIDGRLVFTGRTKNLIVINGQNFFPYDLEELLVSLPGIEAGKVVVSSLWNNSLQREELLVFVNFNDDPDAFLRVRHDIARRLLAAVGLAVDRVIPVKRIPKTTSGKIQHFLLIESYLAGEYDRELEQINRPINI